MVQPALYRFDRRDFGKLFAMEGTYRWANWMPGGAAEFAESLGYSERQMYRLKKLAVERGFLKGDDQ